MNKITLNDDNSEVVNHFKILGVMFFSNMSWDEHIDHVISWLLCVVGLTFRKCRLLPTNAKMLFYIFFLFSIELLPFVVGHDYIYEPGESISAAKENGTNYR